MGNNIFDAGVASAYDETLPSHISLHYLKKRVSFFFRYIKPYAKVLDVGCGTGTILKALSSDPTLMLYGCDNSIDMLKKIDEKSNICSVCCPSDHLPYKQDIFDMVISVAVFHHLGSEDLAADTIREMLRVTKLGGKIIIWDANPLNPYWLFLFRKVPYDREVKKPMPVANIVLRLKDAGIASVKIVRSGWMPDFAPKNMLYIFRIFESVMERIPLLNRFSAHDVIILTKGKSVYVEK